MLDKKVEEILTNYINNNLSDVELISELRLEAKGSSIIFSLLIERLLLVAYDNGQIILSKYLLKQYLQSEHKELYDYAYIGGEASEEIAIKSVHGISIFKGIFIRILEKLNFTDTLNAYVKYLIILEKNEINASKCLSKQDIDKYSKLDDIINILFEEFDTKINSNKKILVYDIKK
jgi:hypothetical protein